MSEPAALPATPLRAIARRLAGARQLNHLVRAEPVVRLARGCAGARTLLDVGSGSLGIGPLLGGEWELTALDVSFDDYGAGDARRRRDAGRVQRVTGDIRAMPFDDGAFDVVVALDVLEHLVPSDRCTALDELARVASRRVIVGCPTGAAALDADRGLAKILGPGAPGWLAEHLENGLPEVEDLVGPLRRHGTVTVVPNERLEDHIALTLRELRIVWFVPIRTAARVLARALRGDGRPAVLAGRVLRRVRGGDVAPTYRTIAALDVEDRA